MDSSILLPFGLTVLQVQFFIIDFTVSLPISSTFFNRHSSLSNVIFNNDVMFDVNLVSEVACIRLCQSDDRCLTLTFNNKLGQCRGHSEPGIVANSSASVGTTIIIRKCFCNVITKSIFDPYLINVTRKNLISFQLLFIQRFSMQ